MTRSTLIKHLKTLALKDTDLARGLEEYGFPEPRPIREGFEALFRIIVSQQISKEAAASIWSRVDATLEGIRPDAVLRIPPDRLRAAGMSARKVEYAKSLAQAVQSGDLDFQKLKKAPEEDVLAAISGIRGLGRWSAEIFMMFGQGRTDVFAADDLALRIALSRLKRKRKQFSATEARKAVLHWSPHRTAGCLFLWHYYRGAPQ
ncbi:MAG: DNA-3-methyladenine glycosylase 2 family protein [Leptospiraceae bacterium]|nr:DNA-3-methyladenine glycosylase 2 family protein [Leptospiraceae bacterium]